MTDDLAVQTTIKLRKEIEKMLNIAREVETEVKANPQSQEVSRRDRIEIVAKREQLEDVRELLVDAEDRLRDRDHDHDHDHESPHPPAEPDR